MDTCTLKWTSLEYKLFSLLCQRVGTKLSQREIAKILRVSPTAVANSIKGIREFVVVEKTKTINFIFLNRDNPLVIELKRVENLKNIYLSGLSVFLAQELAGSTIILFGSYSRGEDIINSDIDIAIIERKDKILSLEKYEKILNRKINIQFYKSWKEIQSHLKNNILNGIILNGSVEL
jgi:predicted nucleotidyltransferase